MPKITHLIKDTIKRNKQLHFILSQFKIKLTWFILGDKKITEKKFKKIFCRDLNLQNPITLNEKIQWLKLYSHHSFHTVVADKYAAREWLSKKFGEEYLVPLIYTTTDYKQINPQNIKDFPCIIKANNGSGSYFIVRNKQSVDWKTIQQNCKRLLKTNYYYTSQEWQYKNIKPRIIVEKLLVTSTGSIPNDYKLHFINGNLEFVYCSVDREGGNYRNIYSPNWTPLDFIWIAPSKIRNNIRGPEIPKPASFNKMCEIGKEIAKLFPYVRVDFYDVDGKLYYGEITLHHGGGFDIFIPEQYDKYYGEKLNLTHIQQKGEPIL